MAWTGGQQQQYPPPPQQQQQWAPQPTAPQQWSGGPPTQQQVPPPGGWGQAPPPAQPPQPPQAPQQWSQPQNPQQWGNTSAPPQYPGQWGGQQQQWGQQPGMCGCCDQCQAGACCQQFPGQQVDPYCCGPPLPDQPDNTLCCDFTCWFVSLFFVLSVIGLAVVLGAHDRDNIFSTFGVENTRDLATAIEKYIPFQVNVTAKCNGTVSHTANTTVTPWVPACTSSVLFGSFGKYCLEDSLNAGTFAANLSHWNNFRGTLYFLAFVITLLFMCVVYAVHRQKHPQGGLMNTSGVGQYNNAPILLFDTPLYEVFRCAWFVTGTVIFFWVANAMTSYWTFYRFYKNNTEGKLHDFWIAYHNKFVASVVCVTIYLSWPLLLLGAEIAVWIAFVIPWLGIRCMLKPGLEHVRPDVPLSEMPGWVRIDMFFTEAQQIRRLGFSNRLWEMVTGSKDAFCPSMDCCQMGAMAPQQPWQQPPHQTAVQMSQRPSAQAPRLGHMGEDPRAHHPAAPAAVPPGGLVAQDTINVRSTQGEEEVTEKKKKKKHHSKEKEGSSTKERKERKSKEKKEKKSKKDKGDDSD